MSCSLKKNMIEYMEKYVWLSSTVIFSLLNWNLTPVMMSLHVEGKWSDIFLLFIVYEGILCKYTRKKMPNGNFFFLIYFQSCFIICINCRAIYDIQIWAFSSITNSRNFHLFTTVYCANQEYNYCILSGWRWWVLFSLA